jgi:uncharacterized protein (TIGR02466 family)
MTYQIHHIFPTPLFSYKNYLPEDYLKEASDCVVNCLYDPAESDEYLVQASKSKNLLKQLPVIKTEILETFKEYAYNILCVDAEIGFKMGSSWSTLTLPNTRSKEHSHANYYYSGCLYVSDNPSSIDFCLGSHIYNYHERFLFKYSDQNMYNSNKISYQPEKNEILFFPSYLKHQISKNTSNENRYSIAFNIHPVGVYGKKDSTIHIDVIDDLD